MPVQVYPMFETAIRAAAGAARRRAPVRISELWSRFSEVAADNPYAWIREPKTRRGDPHAGPDEPHGRASRTRSS